MRKKQGRDEEPSAGIIDSQSIKTSAVRGPEKGIDMGKKSGDAKDTPWSIPNEDNLMEGKVPAMLSMVRERLLWATVAMPKSESYTCPSGPSSIFSGLTSRWITWRSWAYCKAEARDVT
jgi:hypothetical protein